MARTDTGGTRAELAHQQLRADILGGRLTPGQRLKFPELSKRCDASVGVIREALARLAAEGLVRTQAHHGYVVCPLSHEDLADLTTARVEIESLVLHQSVRDGDMAWEAGSVAAHHLLQRTPMTEPSDPTRVTDAWAEAHAKFHLALLVGCRNRRLLDIAAGLREEAELYRRWSVSLGHEPDRDIAGEHRELLEAAVARDADLAAQRLRDHIAHTA
ncbi:MAG: GntR family transcriptional regulator, partial [Haloechinothrix sp.]